jgi:hypothetical protein
MNKVYPQVEQYIFHKYNQLIEVMEVLPLKGSISQSRVRKRKEVPKKKKSARLGGRKGERIAKKGWNMNSVI